MTFINGIIKRHWGPRCFAYMAPSPLRTRGGIQETKTRAKNTTMKNKYIKVKTVLRPTERATNLWWPTAKVKPLRQPAAKV